MWPQPGARLLIRRYPCAPMWPSSTSRCRTWTGSRRSNRGFAEWGLVFADPVVASAVPDRLLHHATAINIRRGSCRMRAHEGGLGGEGSRPYAEIRRVHFCHQHWCTLADRLHRSPALRFISAGTTQLGGSHGTRVAALAEEKSNLEDALVNPQEGKCSHPAYV